jgi:2'-5' RNA ligase
MKTMGKYFLAIVPEGSIQENCHEIKNLIKEKFNIKYALKSPGHITLKMPFSYNEAKEELLVTKLRDFLTCFEGFALKFCGVGSFGKRVVFLKVEGGDSLINFQLELKSFCRMKLNLVEELSDRNFQPHMTIAFKDLKDQHVNDIIELAEKVAMPGEFFVGEIHLLKRIEGRWVSNYKIPIGNPSY